MKRALLAFALTLAVFSTGFITSQYMSNLKVDELKMSSDTIATDILSLETQYALLSEESCKTVNGSSLSDKLTELGDKLAYAEQQTNINEQEVRALKQYYAILQIKDFLLMKRLKTACPQSPVTILYFYSSQERCPECLVQSAVLSKLRQQALGIRVYSFDYHMDLPVVQTLISLYKVGNTLPALVIDGTLYQGYQDSDAIVSKNKTLERLIKEKEKSVNVEKTASSSVEKR